MVALSRLNHILIREIEGISPVVLFLVVATGVATAWLNKRSQIGTWLYWRSSIRRHLPLHSAVLVLRIPIYGIPGVVAYAAGRLLFPRLLPAFTSTDALLRDFVGGFCIGLGVAAASLELVTFSFALVYMLRISTDWPPKITAAGWLRGYEIVRTAFPLLGAPLVIIAVAGEEMAFRGVLLPLFDAIAGRRVAVVVSAAAFVAIQFVGMPNKRNAAPPAISAVIIALVNTVLVLRTGTLLGACIAHVTFFFVLTNYWNLVRGSKAIVVMKPT